MRHNDNRGFTLIELMIVVVIMGVLAAIAIPAFVGYIRRSKTAEASSNIRVMYVGAAAYYRAETWGTMTVIRSAMAAASDYCTVPTATTMNAPGPYKTQLDFETAEAPSFRALGFLVGDPVYYQYGVVGPGTCGNLPNMDFYTFHAMGDLDGDGVQSTFEIQAGSDGTNNLVRSPGVFMTNELE